jgi:hypothetical protein
MKVRNFIKFIAQPIANDYWTPSSRQRAHENGTKTPTQTCRRR